MPKCKQEKAINNTYQILDEFNFSKLRRSFYRPKKLKHKQYREPHGECRRYSEEEVFLFALKRFGNVLSMR